MRSILLGPIISLFPSNTALKFLYARNGSFGCPYTVSIDQNVESDKENDAPPIQTQPKKRGQRGMPRQTLRRMTLHDAHI